MDVDGASQAEANRFVRFLGRSGIASGGASEHAQIQKRPATGVESLLTLWYESSAATIVDEVVGRARAVGWVAEFPNIS